MELKPGKGETRAQLAERQARQDADDKKFASRDPNISRALHERFEAIESRVEEIAAKVGLKAKGAAVDVGEAAGEVKRSAINFSKGQTK